ncbi:MAG TPA: hypothetical protein GX522_01755 [Firmicutes bacterium]|jgi:hypothetical protein|nr:hypothetical protein [Bacillota bacterium]
MRVTGLILGLIGSIWGMFAGLGGTAVFMSIIGIIGAFLAMSAPVWAGWLMIISGCLGWIFVEGSAFLWQGIFLVAGGIFALIGQKELDTTTTQNM